MTLHDHPVFGKLCDAPYGASYEWGIRWLVVHHLSEPIKTSDIANALYISRSKLSTKFKDETGENPYEHILKIKIQEGKELLHYTDKSLTSISYYLGFSSQSHFSRTLKKYEGISPKADRKKHL